ncbi:MAG: serine/threonine-protein kinase [Burkholderiales bacterium]|nr:serine/threonine-protein kinase [Burkholderiales bacterium]
MGPQASPVSEGTFELDLSLQVGKYDVEKLLGKGATGTVYLAIDTFTGEKVALKTIEPEVFRDPEFGSVHRSQFLNEASLAGKIKHPHIAQILEAVMQEDSGYIAMELVLGGDLSAHATPETRLPMGDVLQIGFKCCGALEYAFDEGIVHRDIKPANIMLSEGTKTDVKITDFGSAVLRRSQVVQTATLGSPYYIPPEQIEGEKPTFHGDMYSLGVVLYELLAGQRPFVADRLNALVTKILHERPTPLSRLRDDVPAQIDEVVLRAMARQPAERFQTWSEFAGALSNALRVVLPEGEIPDSERFLSLKRVAMLSALGDAEIWELAQAARWSRARKGEAVVREKEPGTSFFFLAEGEGKVTVNGRLLALVNPGECFGEMAYIRGGSEPRHATVEATSDMLLAEFDPAALARMSLGAQLQLMRALVRNVVDRLVFANRRVGRGS